VEVVGLQVEAEGIGEQVGQAFGDFFTIFFGDSDIRNALLYSLWENQKFVWSRSDSMMDAVAAYG
jgi:hypothetical protein